jgi:hypothetical protein
MSIVSKLNTIRLNRSKETLVKRYLLACCYKLLRFRGGSCLPKNLEIAKKFLRRRATQKQMHQAVWEVEGQAFGADHYSEDRVRFYFRADKNIKHDLLQLRISSGLGNVEARKRLIDMAYFIDSVFCHIQFSSNWFIKDEYEAFLCPILFRRFFGEDA